MRRSVTRRRPAPRLTVVSLEDRSVPAGGFFAVGSEPGAGGSASLVEADTNAARFTVRPFGDGFAGGVSVAVGDVTGDTFPDLIVGQVSGGSEVRVYDGRTAERVAVFQPFGEFAGGAAVAAGDLNDDGLVELVVAARSAAPRVVTLDASGKMLTSVFAFDPSFRGGLSVAAGDVNGDGRDDVLVGAGPGGGPHVKAFSGASGKELFSRFAYDGGFRGGVNVAVADADGDGGGDVIAGAGVGGGPHVRALRGSDGAVLSEFFAGDPAARSGVRVAFTGETVDRHALVVAGPAGEAVRVFDAATGAAVPPVATGTSTPAGVLVGGSSAAAGDVVTVWNEVALRAVATAKTAPPLAARQLSILHCAVFDTVNGYAGQYETFLVSNLPPAVGDPETAAAAAAHRVLTTLFPTQAAAFDKVLAAFTDGRVDPGVGYGVEVADRVIAARADDGATATDPFTLGTNVGDWVPTPPANAAFLLPQWYNVTPFALASGDQFRPDGPPALTSDEYAAAFDEVKRLGSATSTERTADQTEIGRFWAAGVGTVTPPGMWNQIAAAEVVRNDLPLVESARAMALLNAAEADAGVTAWGAKRVFANWRPVTAVRSADTDGNPATTADPTWTSLIGTPPFPDYTSGHSTFSAAAAAVLSGLFGADYDFRTYSSDLPDVSRAFTSFDQAAAEAGKSRIYGGIHFEFANRDGLETGEQVGEYVLANLLRPVDG